MKKILNGFLALVLLLFSPVIFFACGNGKGEIVDYSPVLSMTYSANGFEIKTTDDFVLQLTNDGISLYSEGDNVISFNDTYIYGQYDLGNAYYNFEYISLDEYIDDISKIERCSLDIQNYDIITVKENITDGFSSSLDLRTYIVNENRNPNGDFDWYDIYCFGKSSNSFVFVKVETIIQDEYYEQNIAKLTLILSSLELRKPIFDKSYDESVVGYISNNKWNTDDIMQKWNFRFILPNDYYASINIGENYNDYLTTSIELEEHWRSTIMCKNGTASMGVTILEDLGAKHLINFSTNNYLGFYTKNFYDNSDGTVGREYNFYYLDNNDSLNLYYFSVSVWCSEELDLLGFKNYFEEQLFSWIQDIEILA